MNRGVTISAILLAASVAATAASAQTVTQSTLTGVETSASASVVHNVSGTAVATVYTTPATGFFILTQSCFTSNRRVRLNGNTIGNIVHSGRSRPSKCTKYGPGIALPPNEILTCANLSISSDHSCTITGILSTK